MTCTCGHAIEEHPNGSACDECECIHYEADEEDE